MFRRPKTDREELFEGAQAVIQGEGNTMLYYHRYLYDSEWHWDNDTRTNS